MYVRFFIFDALTTYDRYEGADSKGYTFGELRVGNNWKVFGVFGRQVYA